jgi:pimeloyl-ACP methyl ester carboxylesterase
MRVGRVLRALVFLVGALFVALTAAGVAMFRRDLPASELASAYAGPASRHAAIEGMQVHYRDEGTGPPLVLLHGTFSSLHTWDGWVAHLAARRRLIRLDLPGFGLTGPAPDRDYSAERLARVVAGLLDTLEIDRADLAGNSLGGRVALTFALTHPDRVRKLILLDASGLSGAPTPPIVRLARMPVVNRLLRHLTPRFLVRRNLEEVYGDPSKVTDDLIDRYQAMQRRAGNRQALLDRLNGPADPPLDARIAELRAPVLVMWGEADRWALLAHARRFEREIAGAELKIYPGVGHVPMEELPVQTAADAEAFLARD